MLRWLFLLRSSRLLFCSISHTHTNTCVHTRTHASAVCSVSVRPRGAGFRASYPVCDLSSNTAESGLQKQPAANQPPNHTHAHTHARSAQNTDGKLLCFSGLGRPCLRSHLPSPFFAASDRATPCLPGLRKSCFSALKNRNPRKACGNAVATPHMCVPPTVLTLTTMTIL